MTWTAQTRMGGGHHAVVLIGAWPTAASGQTLPLYKMGNQNLTGPPLMCTPPALAEHLLCTRPCSRP